MNAKEMKALTGAKSAMQAHSMLCDRIKRRGWTYKGNPASFAGADYRRNLVHFTQTLNISQGACSHRRIGLPMEDAIDCLTGNLDGQQYQILY